MAVQQEEQHASNGEPASLGDLELTGAKSLDVEPAGATGAATTSSSFAKESSALLERFQAASIFGGDKFPGTMPSFMADASIPTGGFEVICISCFPHGTSF